MAGVDLDHVVDPLATAGRVCRWRCKAPEHWAWADWGDEVVVYDDCSGSTHLISAGGAAVLEVLERHPQGLEPRSLHEEVFGASGPDADEMLSLAALLIQLEHLRLITSQGA